MRMEHLLEEAKRLSFKDRRRLIDQLEELDDSFEPEDEEEDHGDRYQRTLALAGTMHADSTDVSSDKYKHLADIYADDHLKP